MNEEIHFHDIKIDNMGDAHISSGREFQGVIREKALLHSITQQTTVGGTTNGACPLQIKAQVSRRRTLSNARVPSC